MQKIRNLFRLLSNPLARNYEWGLSRHYWQLFNFFRKLRFYIDRTTFNTRQFATSSRSNVAIFLEFIRVVLPSILFASGLVIILISVEHIIWRDIYALGESATSSLIDWPTYRTILTTLAQIAGIFLGLYFASLSFVASAVYVRVAPDVRELLFQDKVSHLAIRIVAVLGSVSLLLLLTNILGFQPGLLNLICVAILGVLVMFSIVTLTMRIFRFLDSTIIIDLLLPEIVKSIKSTTFGGLQWQNQSFQQYHGHRVQYLLKAFGHIAQLATEEPYTNAESIKKAGRNALGLLRFYSEQKPHIPITSLWFSRIYSHPNWLTADSTRVSLALRSGTGLQPEEVPDRMWFESKIENIVLMLAESLYKYNPSEALDLLNEIYETVGYLAGNFAVPEAIHLMNCMNASVHDKLIATQFDWTDTRTDSEESSLGIAFIDICGFGMVSMLVRLTDQLRSTTEESFGSTITGIDWTRPKTIHEIKLPRNAMEKLEFMLKPLEFERKVEGRQVSPLWYQQQIACLGYLEFLSEATNSLISSLESFIKSKADALVSKKRYIYAIQHIQRGLEAVNKFNTYSREAKACHDRLLSFRKVKDIPFSEINWTEISDRSDKVRGQLLINLAKCSIDLPKTGQQQQRPDYFGQTYSYLAEESYSSMVSGDESLLSKIFPAFFWLSISAFERLYEQLKDVDEQRRTVFSTEPIADLLHLSCFAYLYSELDGKGFWDTVTDVWDKYYEGRADRKELIEFIVSIMNYRSSIFAILPRDTLRTEWMIRFEHILRDRGLMHDRLSGDLTQSYPGEIPHSSPIIRLLARRGVHFMDKPDDIFLAIYLFVKPEAEGVSWPRQVNEFILSIEREKSRGEDPDEEQDGE